LLSAFFSGSEIAFVSASKLEVEIKRESGSRRGAILGKFYDRPDHFLGTMLVGNNIALVVLTYFMTELIDPLYKDFIHNEAIVLLITTLVITIFVLIFGEFLPKTIFRLFANESLFFLAYPLRICSVLLAVPTWVMLKVTNLFMGLFINKTEQRITEALTRTDLYHYIDETLSDFNEDIDKEIFTNALNLNQLKVRDCLIPRTDIVYFDISDPIEELIQLFRESKLSRIIIVDDEIDKVVGYIHHQQLLSNPKQIKKIVLEIPFVPESMNVRDLMLRFIRESTNIACVVNEFGGTSGLITLEDILEEIFGEIEDEHDIEDLIEEQIAENEYLFSGRSEISHLNEAYANLDLPEGEYHTLSGYLVMTAGKIPDNQGDIIELDGFSFVIEKLSDNKIDLIRVIKKIEVQ
jgi:CBS domain containing-hemolysin-like protein